MKRYNTLVAALLLSISTYGQLVLPKIDKDGNSNANINEQDIVSGDEYLGFLGRGKYSVWFGCDGNGQARSHIEKPFIWVEGINLEPNNVQKSNEPVYANALYFPLMKHGFDIVQLDFNNNPQYIQRNAALLITLIKKLQNEMNTHGSKQEIVIMGTSMGAMVARYALTKMENDGEKHNVRLYISHDSQHRGANVPWGLQYMVEDISGDNLIGFFIGVSSLSVITNTFAGQYLFGPESGISGIEAAFQLLRDSPSPIATVLRQSFALDLATKGNYPNDCRKIAIANGANNGVGLTITGDNHQILRLTFPSLTSTLVDRRVFVAPGLQNSLGSRIVYSKIASNLLSSKLRFYPHGLQDWDIAPGGTFFKDESLLLDHARTRPFTFVPTVSALGINTNDPFYNVAANIPDFGTHMTHVGYTFNSNITEFDAIWANAVNADHAVLEGSAVFILSEVSPDNLYIQNKTVSNGVAKMYEAKTSVTLGKNETTTIAVGDVVFENGSEVVIRAGKEIIWKDGFEAAAGSNTDYRIEFL